MKRKILFLALSLVIQFSLFGQFTPSNSPDIQFNWQGNGSGKDFLFLAAMRQFTPSPRKPTNMIWNAEGDLIWYYQGNNLIYDFKMQSNNRLTYNQNNYWWVLDSTFAIVDSFRCIDAATDIHDFVLREDDHAFLICHVDSIADLSAITSTSGTPGNINGRFDGNIIQELDANKNLVKQWHTWDHYQITDADTSYFDNPNRLDLTHTNSIDIDDQGNVLISHRNINEVLLVDWNTGNIKWRLTGAQSNFDLLGDPGTFAQHDARFLPNNRISIFDNGTMRHAPRGVVYEIDTVNWIANLVSEYEITNTLSDGMGSFRLLADSTAIVCIGNIGSNSYPLVYQFDSNSNLVYDLEFQSTYHTYRAIIDEINFELNRPDLTCELRNGDIILGLADHYDRYLWTTDETTNEIVVADTGWYHVYVPSGIGMLASEKVHVTDIAQGCSGLVANTEAIATKPKTAKLLGRFDVLGRPISNIRKGQLYIERYSDGSQRKCIQL